MQISSVPSQTMSLIMVILGGKVLKRVVVFVPDGGARTTTA